MITVEFEGDTMIGAAEHRANNFEFVRLAAASLVVLEHSHDLMGLPGLTWLGTSLGTFSVQIFFVVSGYLVCQSWNSDTNVWRFLAKRSLRLLPALAAVVILSAFLFGPMLSSLNWASYMRSPEVTTYLWNIALAPNFLLPGLFAGNHLSAVNGSLWTLPVEFAMYLALPLYGTMSSKISRVVLLPICLVVTAGLCVYLLITAPTQLQPVFYWTSVPMVFQLAPYFVVGAAIASFRLEKILSLQVSIIMLGVLPCVMRHEILFRLALVTFTPYIVLSFCLARWPLLSFMQKGPDISYGVYLWAFPIQQTLLSKFGAHLTPEGLFAAALPLAWAAGWLSSRYVEQPAMRLKPRSGESLKTWLGRGASLDWRTRTQTIDDIPVVVVSS